MSEDVVRSIDKRRAIAPGSDVRASRSMVIDDILRRVLESGDVREEEKASSDEGSGAEDP